MIEELKPKARAQGLWNLFLPPTAGGKARRQRRVGLTNQRLRAAGRDHGPRAVGAARSSTARRPTPATWRRSCATARAEHKERWLEPLLDGKIRSAFAMTEPDGRLVGRDQHRVAHRAPAATSTSSTAASGGPRAPATRAARSTSSWARPTPTRRRHSQQSMILVPADTPGITVAAPAVGVRLRRRAARPHGSALRERARAGGEHAARRRPRLRDRARPPRAGPHPPLHAPDRAGRARARADVQARVVARRLRQARWRSRRVTQERIAEARCRIDMARLLTLEGRVDDGRRRQQGRQGRDRDDQGGGAEHGVRR